MADPSSPPSATTPAANNKLEEAPTSASTSGAASPASPSNAAEQARLRRERREAKIRAGGSARLGKITSMGGRPSEATSSTPVEGGGDASSAIGTTGGSSTTPSIVRTPSGTLPTSSPGPGQASGPSKAAAGSPAAQGGDTHDDPAEVDISQHFPSISSNSSRMDEPRQDFMGLLQQQMMGNRSQSQNQARSGQGQEQPQDPMTQLLSQLMGSQTGEDGQEGPMPGLPPALAQLLGGQSPSSTGTQAAPSNGTSSIRAERDSTSIWRIVHAISAFALGIYVILLSSSTSFTGSKASRLSSAAGPADFAQGGMGMQPPRLLWMFATLELILQSTRFFMERGRLPGSSGGGAGSGARGVGMVLSTVAQFLPPPYGEYVRVAIRYGIMASTVVADALVVVFVLGCVAWWRGGAEGVGMRSGAGKGA